MRGCVPDALGARPVEATAPAATTAAPPAADAVGQPEAEVQPSDAGNAATPSTWSPCDVLTVKSTGQSCTTPSSHLPASGWAAPAWNVRAHELPVHRHSTTPPSARSEESGCCCGQSSAHGSGAHRWLRDVYTIACRNVCTEALRIAPQLQVRATNCVCVCYEVPAPPGAAPGGALTVDVTGAHCLAMVAVDTGRL